MRAKLFLILRNRVLSRVVFVILFYMCFLPQMISRCCRSLTIELFTHA